MELNIVSNIMPAILENRRAYDERQYYKQLRRSRPAWLIYSIISDDQFSYLSCRCTAAVVDGVVDTYVDRY